MTVRDVFRGGRMGGVVVTGCIESGTVRTGDALDIVRGDSMVKTRVRGVEISRKIVEAATAQEEVGILIDDVEGHWITRGDRLCGE